MRGSRPLRCFSKGPSTIAMKAGSSRAGEVQWMTAGRGIIHGENVGAKGMVRLLQLWLTLPKADRWTDPGFQAIHNDAVPFRRENGAAFRIYSGGSGSLRSKTQNHVPVTITEILMNIQTATDFMYHLHRKPPSAGRRTSANYRNSLACSLSSDRGNSSLCLSTSRSYSYSGSNRARIARPSSTRRCSNIPPSRAYFHRSLWFEEP
jgi:Pirin